MPEGAPTYVGTPKRLLQWVTSPSLFITVVLFGAILDFGATNAASALFWASLQCACAAYVMARRPEGLAPPRWLDLAAGGLFVVLLIVAAMPLITGVALDRYANLVELVKLVGLGAFCLAGYRVASEEAEAERLFTWITLAGAIYAVWAIVSFLQTPAFVLGIEKQQHLERLTASFLSANTAGSLFGALGCALAVRLFRRVGRKLGGRIDAGADDMARWGGELRDAALLALYWITLLLTVSRAALSVSLGVVALFGLLELRRYGQRRRLKGRAMAIAAAVVLAAFVVLLLGSLSSQLQGQFGRLSADAISRTGILDAYLPRLAETPLLGHGLGSFPALNARVMTDATFPQLWNLGAAHNIVLQWWLEAGPVGLGLAAVMVLLILIRLVIRTASGRVGRWRAAVALAVSAVLLGHNAVDYSLQVQGVAALWALMLGFGLAERSSRNDRPADET